MERLTSRAGAHVHVTADIRISPRGPDRNRMTQQRRHFFLNVDDDVSFTQILTQTGVLTTERLIFFFQGMALGLRPAFLRSQRFADALVTLASPRDQVRGIQTLAAKQRSNPAPRRRCGMVLFEDALLIFRGETAPLGFGNHFGIHPQSRRDSGNRFGCRCTALRLATLAFAPFRASQTPRGKNHTKRIPVHLCLFSFSPYSLNKGSIKGEVKKQNPPMAGVLLLRSPSE